ncbi:hypothetical protein HZA41_03245 [Candidatus Peregrinibacteria bacterium]|nr:hypothetical protein [Candidatus Peregrinibacteria bacterium]
MSAIGAPFLLWLFVHKSLPSYLDKKAKNLATKEDIATITREIEEVKHLYQKHYDLSRIERDFYNEMNKAIWSLLAIIKKYEFENKKPLNEDVAKADPSIKKIFFSFVDSANEILGKAFIFLPEKNYILLKTAIEEKSTINGMAKNLLFAMRKSIYPETKLNKNTDIKELNY